LSHKNVQPIHCPKKIGKKEGKDDFRLKKRPTYSLSKKKSERKKEKIFISKNVQPIHCPKKKSEKEKEKIFVSQNVQPIHCPKKNPKEKRRRWLIFNVDDDSIVG